MFGAAEEHEEEGCVLFASSSGIAVGQAIEHCESCIYQFYEGSNQLTDYD